jgi:hypothetical protein
MTSAVLKGKMIHFSTNPYGYTTDSNGIIKIEETEAQVVKMIFDLAIKGTTLYTIASTLNSADIPTRLRLKNRKRKYLDGSEGYTKWTPVTVSRILKRKLYTGVREYKEFKVPVPVIISEETFNSVQQRFIDNIGYLNNTKHNYLFKGKIRCGKCKRMITTHFYHKHKDCYYECEGVKKTNNKCDYKALSLNVDIVDANLYDAIFNHKYIYEIMSQKSTEATDKENKLKQIQYYQGEIENINLKEKRQRKIYVDGYVPYDEFEREITTLTNLRTSFNNKIALLENEITNINRIDINEVIKTYRNSTDYSVKRDFVEKYVNSVIMYKIDGANVQWNTPLTKDEKIIYFEMTAFNYLVPLKILITPHSKNIIASTSLQFIQDYNIVVDINGSSKSPDASR